MQEGNIIQSSLDECFLSNIALFSVQWNKVAVEELWLSFFVQSNISSNISSLELQSQSFFRHVELTQLSNNPVKTNQSFKISWI